MASRVVPTGCEWNNLLLIELLEIAAGETVQFSGREKEAVQSCLRGKLIGKTTQLPTDPAMRQIVEGVIQTAITQLLLAKEDRLMNPMEAQIRQIIERPTEEQIKAGSNLTEEQRRDIDFYMYVQPRLHQYKANAAKREIELLKSWQDDPKKVLNTDLPLI